jgi:hypothetical protein
MNKIKHPHNRAERLKLKERDRLKSRISRPARRDVEAIAEEADDELHGEFFGDTKA